MGGHGPHIHGNESNMQETDDQMTGKIQRVDLIKFNPNHFHMTFFSAESMYNILGGAPTMVCGAVGAVAAYGYYAAAGQSANFYANNMRVTGRLFMGLSLGLTFGFNKFGDRQRLHNAYIAERLRRRYPESLQLSENNLWKLKGITAPHEFYQWK